MHISVLKLLPRSYIMQ